LFVAELIKSLISSFKESGHIKERRKLSKLTVHLPSLAHKTRSMTNLPIQASRISYTEHLLVYLRSDPSSVSHSCLLESVSFWETQLWHGYRNGFASQKSKTTEVVSDQRLIIVALGGKLIKVVLSSFGILHSMGMEGEKLPKLLVHTFLLDGLLGGK
jgi:hypothetical protein